MVAAILALAAAVRVASLETVPELHVQEAARGLAIQMGATAHGIFGTAQAFAVHLLGNTAFALRLPAVLAGVLMVLAVYALARRMFDSRELAAYAGVLAATGFWGIVTARVGLPTVMPALWAAAGFAYLYQGIETHRLWHWGLAGLFFGLGIREALDFWTVLSAVILTLTAWWWGIRAVFRHESFAHARHQGLGGVAAMLGVLILVALPFLAVPGASPAPIGLAGEPAFFWAVSALLVAGILHSLWRIGQSLRKRGHPGVPQVLLLSWFALAFLPGALEGSLDLSAALVFAYPAACVLGAVGLHWLAVWLRKWYARRDRHQVCLPFERFAGRHCVGEGTLLVGIATVALLLAVGVADAGRYFGPWASAPATRSAFPAGSHAAAASIMDAPPATLKFVVTASPGPIRYLTGTGTPEAEQRLHVVYLTPDELAYTRLPANAAVIRPEAF